MQRLSKLDCLQKSGRLLSLIQLRQCTPSLQYAAGTHQGYSSSVNKDFIHESIIPSDHFQAGLLRLKIPPLEKTCERYLKSQSVMQTPEEHAHTQEVVARFRAGDGKELARNLKLLDKQNKHTSYISEPWFDMYLRDRRPVPLTHTPFMSFTDDPRPEYMDQLLRATNMVVYSLKFMKTLRANVLAPDLFHLNPKKTDNEKFQRLVSRLPSTLATFYSMYKQAYPLDMSQYANLFNSTRIPRFDKDELYVDTSAKHMLVLRNGHLYLFDAIDRDGNVVAPEVIMSHLKYILNDPRPPNDQPIGILTTMHRDKWTTVRTQLCNAGVMNDGYMKLVDSSLFVLVLDDCTPQDPNAITRNFLHSDGTNRWWDKCFSLLLTKDGRAAVNFEHSWGDGVAVLRYFNEVWKESTTKPVVHPDTVPANVDSDRTVQKIEFALDPKLKEYIQEAKDDFKQKTSSLDVDHLEYKTFTKKYLKEQKVSPDAMLQFAIQLAYYRLHGRTASTYESCSTAAFKKGRTETVRSATPATKAACEMFLNSRNPVSAEELREALEQCSKYHSQLTKEAAMGQGWDRHLFAMKHLAQKEGRSVELFNDPAYASINHIILSTSTLASPAVVIGGFGAVTNNGYGVGYAVEDDRIGFNVTNYPPETNVHQFIECCRLALDDIHEVFQGKNPRSS